MTGAQHTADLLDLLVNTRARINGALLVLVCDDQLRPIQPILIENDNAEIPRPPDMTEALWTLAEGVARTLPGATALVALSRREGRPDAVGRGPRRGTAAFGRRSPDRSNRSGSM
ncbi:MAG: hypothetical protein V9E82_09690 [Candidatus Nanopelagicales bacterium]